MATATKKVKIGQAVVYVSSKGYEKLAFVTATPETVQPGHALPELQDGFLHLQVMPPTGHHYPRLSVPSVQAAKDIPDYAVDGDEPKGVWKLV